MKTILLILGFFSFQLRQTQAQVTHVDFEEWAANRELIPGMPLPGGVTFNPPVTVVSCSAFPNCGAAHSGSKVAVALPQDEFRRNPFTILFATPQRRVSLYVKREYAGAPISLFFATLNAYDEAGLPVGNASIRLGSRSGWEVLEVGSEFASPTITRVVIWGGLDGIDISNHLLVDDLEFEGEGFVPPSADVEPPRVQILSPAFGTTVREPRVNVRIRVQDDQILSSVIGRIINSVGVEVTGIDFCGTTFSTDRHCPGSGPTLYNRLVSVSLPITLEDGTYTIQITACDASANCTTRQMAFGLDLPEIPPIVNVRVLKVEVNQAVQNRLFDVDGPGTVREAHSTVPIVPEKPTLVRYYLMTDGAPRAGYSGRLRIQIWRDDGSNVSRTYSPNVGGISSIDVIADPVSPLVRRDSLMSMRAKIAKTLNFVIPGRELRRARRIELTLLGPEIGHPPVTGRLQLGLHRPVRLGVNFVRVTVRGSGVPRPSIESMSSIVPYLQSIFPVSEVRVLSVSNFLTTSEDDACEYQDEFECAFGGGDVPARYPTVDPHFTVTLGVLTQIVGRWAGCADIGDPDDDDEREGGVASTIPVTNTAAHEIGHLIGLAHAGASHRECRGGGCETGFPNPHGTLGNGYLEPSDFGIVLSLRTIGGAARDQWDCYLIDPCPTDVLGNRFPCTVADGNMPHDLMSYGGGRIPAGFPLNSNRNVWLSALNYGRIYNSIRHRIEPRSYGLVESGVFGWFGRGIQNLESKREEAYIIRAVIQEDGTAKLRPLLRKQVQRSNLEQVEPGAYELELWDGEGNLLLNRSFDANAVQDGNGQIRFIQQIVPYKEGVKRLIIKYGDAPIIDQVASLHNPQVSIKPPIGGVIQPGEQTVAWEASDEDGDFLTFFVQYSPDAGRTWYSLAYIKDSEVREIQVTIPEVKTYKCQFIRLTVSDGLNTTLALYQQPLNNWNSSILIAITVIIILLLVVWWSVFRH